MRTMKLVTVIGSFLAVSSVEGYITTVGSRLHPPAIVLGASTAVPSRRGWYRRRSNNDSTISGKRRRRSTEPVSIDLHEFTAAVSATSVRPKAGLFHKLTCQWVASVVSRLISRNVQRGDIQVQVHLHHGFRKLLSSGIIHADAILNVPHSLHFNALRFSKGVVEAYDILMHVPTQQYLRPFTLIAKDIELTANDLMESPCIRHGLRRLLTRVLISDFAVCRIDDIRIENNNKLVLLGTVTTILGQRVPFQVASGMEAANGMLVLKELNVNVNGFWVKKFPLLSLDVGPNSCLQSVVLKDNAMVVSATVTVTPDVPEASGAPQATWAFDVGRWLTDKVRFEKSTSTE